MIAMMIRYPSTNVHLSPKANHEKIY